MGVWFLGGGQFSGKQAGKSHHAESAGAAGEKKAAGDCKWTVRWRRPHDKNQLAFPNGGVEVQNGLGQHGHGGEVEGIERWVALAIPDGN